MDGPEYPILTRRLLLRPIDPDRDAEAMYAYRSLPQACRYVPFEPSTRERIAKRLADPANLRSDLHSDGDALSLAITLRDSGEMIGDLVLFLRSVEHRAAEIGYIINPVFQGSGYATEAAAGLLALAFDTFGMHRVTAQIDVRNVPSITVAKRLGMRQEGVMSDVQFLKGEWVSLAVFAMLEEAWRSDRLRRDRAAMFEQDG